MPSKTFPQRRSFVRIIMPVAVMTALMYGCARDSGIATDAVAPSATKQPQRNLTDPSRVLVKAWSAPGTFDKVTHVALFGQVLYVAGTPPGIHAIDTFDGLRLWSHPCKGPLAVDIMQSSDDVYLIEGRDVVKLAADDGVELVRERTRLGALSAILPGSESWVIATTDDRIWGMVPNTGRGYWRVTFDDPIADMIEDGGDTLYVHTLNGTIYRVSRNAREIEWRLRFPKPAASPMVMVANRILVGSEDYFLYEVSPETGEILSRVCLSAPILGTPLVAEPLLYIAAGGKLHAIDSGSLEVQWTLDDATRALTVAGDEVIYLGERDGHPFLGVADTNTGKVVTETSADGFKFFVAAPLSGVVFAIADNGNILAIAHRNAVDSLPTEPVPARGQEHPDKAAAREAIRQLHDAAISVDMKKLLAGLTPESAEFARSMIETKGADTVCSLFAAGAVVIGRVHLDGETASVQTNVVAHPEGKIITAHMARIGGVWKLDLVKSIEEIGNE